MLGIAYLCNNRRFEYLEFLRPVALTYSCEAGEGVMHSSVLLHGYALREVGAIIFRKKPISVRQIIR